MRLKFALAVAAAALASVVVGPAAAHAAPDGLACAAAGSYRNAGQCSAFRAG